MSGAVPKLRFPEFEREWTVTKLREFGSFRSGNGFPDAEQGGKAGIPFYKVSDMNLQGNENIMTVANHYVDSGQIARLKLKPITKKSIIFAKVGAAIALERKRVAEDFLIDNNMMAFIPNEEIDFNYCVEVLRNTEFSRFTQVGALPSYNASDIGIIPIPLPPLLEQQKIADFLGTVDAKLDALRQKKSGLEAFKSGLMQKIFSQEIRFTREDGSDFPDWEEKTLGELGSFSKGKGISKSDITPEGDLPCIRYGELCTQYSERITNIVSRTDVPPSSLTLSQVNDVIIPASGETPIDMARACCVLVTGVALGGDINIFRSQLNGEYLAYLLTNARRTEIAQMAQGNSVVHLYPAQLRQIIVPVPHPEEQRRIADALSTLDAKITAVADQITHMEAFKKGLLQQMFV